MSSSLTLFMDTLWISPYVFSCFVALREKELSFEVRTIAMEKGEQRTRPYREESLTGRVPVLKHEDFYLAESSAIIEYLDDVFPETTVLPSEPQPRARARQVMAWIRSDLMAIREERSSTTIFYPQATPPLSEAGQMAWNKLLYIAERLIPKEPSFLFGTFSVADADLAFMLQRLLCNQQQVPPHIQAYVTRVWERPSVAEFVTHKRPAYVPYIY
jgi:glutathione S-transferase